VYTNSHADSVVTGPQFFKFLSDVEGYRDVGLVVVHAVPAGMSVFHYLVADCYTTRLLIFALQCESGAYAVKLCVRCPLVNENAPIQLPQCCSLGSPFPVLKYIYIFSSIIYGSNFIKQHSETVMV